MILKKCLGLLKALARGNDFVQLRMFERLDILLKIKVVESDVAIALKEVINTQPLVHSLLATAIDWRLFSESDELASQVIISLILRSLWPPSVN